MRPIARIGGLCYVIYIATMILIVDNLGRKKALIYVLNIMAVVMYTAIYFYPYME